MSQDQETTTIDSAKTRVFLNLSVSFEADVSMPIDEVIETFKDSLEGSFALQNLIVAWATWDRQAALSFVRALDVTEPEKDGSSTPTSDVARVLEQYNLTLPKAHKNDGLWRVPKGHAYGEVAGLPGFRGKVILTNGVIAILVQDDHKTSKNRCHWMQIHWDWFIPDKDFILPEGIKQPKGENKSAKAKAKLPKELESFFNVAEL